jgi:hypothetical protein
MMGVKVWVALGVHTTGGMVATGVAEKPVIT